MIIGVDHGYGMMKTAHFAFPTGITMYEHEPYSLRNTLKVNGKYYVCGSGRQSLTRDKTQNDNYFLLTLVAIAKELEYRGVNSAEIVLAVGLPLTRFGLDKQSFHEYLSSYFRTTREYEFEGNHYTVRVKNIVLYPQGYSAIMGKIHELRREPSIIVCDIGSWTVDAMRLDKGIPNAELNRSLELGMIRCVNDISEQLRRTIGVSVTDSQIEDVLIHGGSNLPVTANRIVLEYGKLYGERIISTLLENGLDVEAVPVIFIGGGASLIQNFIPETRFCNAEFITDLHANAKGYEYIARQAFPNG